MTSKAQTVAEALSGMASDTADARDANALAVPLSDIPLPPEELADQLDNSGAAAAQAAPAEVATLDFVGDDLPEQTFPLKYPFRWEGARIDAITVRQLRTGQMGDVYRQVAAEKRGAELYDFYAAMCGLPAKVLRALPAIDGEPIIDKAWDFLPRSLRPENG